MSAVVCGKRHFFEDQHPLHHHHHHSPPALPPSKRRRSSAEASAAGGIDRLASLFPEMPPELLEKALEASQNDLNAAIKRLLDLRLDAAETGIAPSALISEDGLSCEDLLTSQDSVSQNVAAGMTVETTATVDNLPANGFEWVDVLVREMASAGDINDARCRASRVLETFEKSVRSHVGNEVIQSSCKENLMFKEQMEALLRENSILKRAVAIQHERQKEHNERIQELQQVKQLVVQYQDQVRNLELNNYSLSIQLRQAQQNNSMPGHFHPDVF